MASLRLFIIIIIALTSTTILCYSRTRMACRQQLENFLALDMFIGPEAQISNSPFSQKNNHQILFLMTSGSCPKMMEKYNCKNTITWSVELTHRNISLLKMYTTNPMDIIRNERHSHLNSNDTCFADAFNSELLQLDLSHNVLEIIQYDFSILRNLETLYLSHNRLRYVTAPFIGSLEILDLSYNYLNVMPSEFFMRLPNLTHIDLSNNHLIHFSPFTYPKKLRKLYLAQNKLSALNIFKLQRLGNALKEITLAANPWTCDCMFDLMEFTTINKIRRPACDENYFTNGDFPVCVVTEHMPCGDDYIHGTTRLEEFHKIVRNFSC